MKRNVLLVVSSMNEGGAERVAAHLVNAWSEGDYDVTLLITFSGHGKCFFSISERVTVVYLSDLAKIGRSRLVNFWKRFWTLRRFIRSISPDVVVSFLTNVNLAALVACIGLNYPVIVSERTHPPAYSISAILMVLRKILYPRASRVVMLSREGLSWLQANIPNAKGLVIPNPVRLPLPASMPTLRPERFVSPERKLLLAVGRMDQGKQFDRLVDSFATIADLHFSWSLVIIGEGPARLELERQIVALGLQQQVSLPGRAGNLGDWYHRADLYVMSSKFEGFPNTLVEAMSHGCAVVSYDCETGPRDIIRNNKNGLLVTPVGDVRALAMALERLMADDAERERMGARAIEVRERFSMEKILTMWESTFLAVITARKRSFSEEPEKKEPFG